MIHTNHGIFHTALSDCASQRQLGDRAFGILRSKGAIQKLVNRVSEALVSHETAMGQMVRTSLVHDMDETSWLQHGERQWLWGMANPAVATLQIHPNRSTIAFAQLLAAWRGMRVSDGY